MFPHCPKNIQDVIEGMWSTILEGQRFLLANDVSDRKILLFGTIEFLRKLCTADTVYMDGTFKSCPSPFKQIYTIHCFIVGKMFPIAYGLLPDKTRQTYIRFLNLVKQAALNHQLKFQPEIFQIDFELDMLSAIQEQFPMSRVCGCFSIMHNAFGER